MEKWPWILRIYKYYEKVLYIASENSSRALSLFFCSWRLGYHGLIDYKPAESALVLFYQHCYFFMFLRIDLKSPQLILESAGRVRFSMKGITLDSYTLPLASSSSISSVTLSGLTGNNIPTMPFSADTVRFFGISLTTD